MFAFKLLSLLLVGVVVCKPSGPYGGGSSGNYGGGSSGGGAYNGGGGGGGGYGNGLSAAIEEPYEERNYKVYYSVKDDPSYNFQTRDEEKDGKTVKGQYTVLEPTGELRIVKYIADENGFRADVTNQAGYGQPYPVPVQQPAYQQQAYQQGGGSYERIQAKPY